VARRESEVEALHVRLQEQLQEGGDDLAGRVAALERTEVSDTGHYHKCMQCLQGLHTVLAGTHNDRSMRGCCSW
jgi:hypothetical protein